LLAVVAIGAFFMSQRADTGPVAGAPVTPPIGSVINDSVSIASVPATPESAAAAPAPVLVDSVAIKDSIRKARREAAKKAAALADSANKAQPTNAVTESNVVKARVAARSLLDDAAARKAFMDGATHKGGVFGAKRKGDLQTQIDALAPFLGTKGLSYEQFKAIVRESGVNLFDEFGRMLPNALQQFATGGR